MGNISKKESLKVAARFVILANEMNKEGFRIFLPHRKLQCLIAFLNLSWYQKYGKLLLEEQLEFFKLSPVCRKVYQEYRIYGNEHINNPHLELVYDSGGLRFRAVNVEEFEPEVEWLMVSLLILFENENLWEMSGIVYSYFEKKERGIMLKEDDYKKAKIVDVENFKINENSF